MQEISFEQAQEILKKTNGILLDVRSYEEFCEEHLMNAVNMDLYNLQKNIQTIIPNKNTVIVTYCACGSRSKQAMQILVNLGYNNVYSIKGGMYCRYKEKIELNKKNNKKN